MSNNNLENIKYYIEVLEDFDNHYRELYPNEEPLPAKDKEQLNILIEFLKKDAKTMLKNRGNKCY